MKIKFLDLSKINKLVLDKSKNQMISHLYKGNYILEKNVSNFEKEFANFNNAKYCVGVNSGHDALKIAMLSLGVKPNDQIIVPAMTYVSTFFSISQINAKPIPFDVNSYGVLDVTKLPKSPNRKIKGIVAVNLYGNLCDYKSLKKYCKKNSLFLLEDSSQSHGSYFKNEPKKRTWGDAAAFSFYPGKNLGSICDGGAIITNNHRIYKISLNLRNYGSTKKYHHVKIGYNSRINSTSTIFLKYKLKILNKENSIRRIQEAKYIKEFKKIKNLSFLKRSSSISSSHHIFMIFCKTRNKLKKFLEKKRIETLIHYPIIPPRQKPYVKKINYKKNFQNAIKIQNQGLSIPLGSHLTKKNQSFIISQIKKFFNDYKLKE
jgi:dTDP-4-amino-4,6-dideoxygalactose transaminase